MKKKRSNRKTDGDRREANGEAAPVRAFWTGTLTFGLVSIPVDLYSAVRPRQTALKLVDKDGHALGRQYHCSEDGRKLTNDDLVRGYETESGDFVVITDEEFESVAPEMSRDIELRSFVPLEQISPLYFQRPYYLAPAGGSSKAYHLLAQTMERTGRVAIGSFVMRGREYLAAILSENGVLRAQTLRHLDEIRSPEYVGLPKPAAPAARKVAQFSKDVERLTHARLDMAELADREADALLALARDKQKSDRDVIRQQALEEEDAEAAEGGKVVDLMEVLRKSLSKNAVVTNARGAATSRSDHRPRAQASRNRPNGLKSASRSEDLAHASKADLQRKAAELHIRGRSRMDKGELLRAIRRTA
jgi:DNA end-binding protein Ku